MQALYPCRYLPLAREAGARGSFAVLFDLLWGERGVNALQPAGMVFLFVSKYDTDNASGLHPILQVPQGGK